MSKKTRASGLRRASRSRAKTGTRRVAIALITLLFAGVSGVAISDVDDDLFLFTTSVPPNIMVLLDNSGSMNHIVWHPAFDPTITKHYNTNGSECKAIAYNSTLFTSSTFTATACGNTRTVYNDPAGVGGTRWDWRYINWYFSDEADPYISQIDDASNGTRICNGPGSPTFAKYQINRLSAAKKVVLDTICKFEATKTVRIGLATFREPKDYYGVDPNGGYVVVGIDDQTPAHANDLEAAVNNEKPDTWTPLAESLFQVYTYFMSRTTSDLPEGKTTGVYFPKYVYKTTPSSGGGAYSTSGPPTVPDSPVQYSCQKNFVVIITDGEPTMDDWDTDPTNTSRGFADFTSLIGDYNNDGETEITGVDEGTLYLDDVAKYMHENDSRPDMTGDQLFDVYAIGFTTEGPANSLLQKTATQGNGLFFNSNNAEELTAAITTSISDIIEKSQSFTAATVPSTRTSSGGDFYTSFFLPSAKTAFWEGHLRAFQIDAAGDILDKNDSCALIDPDPGECNSGAFDPAAQPFWDAGEEVPVPGSRSLYVSRLNSGTPTMVDFDTATMAAADLGIQTFTTPPAPAPNPTYPGSGALNAEGLADEIVSYTRGCDFGTGVAGADVSAAVTCSPKSWRLGDIFHSAPSVVTGPKASNTESSYGQFKSTYSTRKRVIYAGSNDGFLHAFDAGTWQASTTPPGYDRGTGAEIFGFMPWEVRKSIKNFYVDTPTDRTYYVDGSPQAADVWFYPTSTSVAKAATDWKTILLGGLRQGGRAYYALDITDPSAGSYPGYLWEFPNENDPDNVADPTSILPYLGDSWSQPVITRVRVKIGTDDNGGVGYERWVAVVTGGYSANGDPNDHANYDATAREGRAIMMIDLTSGELLAMKRMTTSGVATNPERDMIYAIPSKPAVYDLDSDGYADVVYVGDLGGQVFKWVVSSLGEDRVNDTSSAGDYSQPNWPFKIFFKAPIENVSGTDYFKSIFFPPAGAFISNKLWISFATGERANLAFEGFSGSDENNRFYSMRDTDPYELLTTPNPALTESDLSDVTTDESCQSISSSGYYFKVADGEKFVTNVDIFASLVLAASFTPSNTGNPCTSKGQGTLYVFRVDCSGGYFDFGSGPTRKMDLGEGLPTDPQVSVGVDGKKNIAYIEKSGSDMESVPPPDIEGGAKTLLYWREMP